MPNSGNTKIDVQQFGSLTFWSEESAGYSMKIADGLLSSPNTSPRDRKKHQAVSKGTGDDAGHLIARRFGGPDAACNFTRQNYRQNQGGGTYYNAEKIWAAALATGAQVHVTVRAMTRLGDDRTFYREAEWTITSKTNQKSHGKVSYLNSESARTREAAGVAVPQHDTLAPVIPLRRL